jgi:hypothetical protein
MTEAKKEKKPIDWEAIETDWRAGIKSVLQIANEQGNVSHTAINKHFKKLNVPRDLSAKIKARSDAIVSAAMVSAKVSVETTPKDAEIIEVNAQMQAAVLLSHRSDITRYRALATKLLGEIEIETDNPESFAELAEVIIWRSGEDGEVQTKEEVARMTRMQKLFDMVMSNPGRVESLKKLSETMKNLIGLERQALGLKDDYQPPAPDSKPRSRAEFYGSDT